VLDATAVVQVDSTAAGMLDEMRVELAARGLRLGLAELNSEVRDLLARAGLLDAIGAGMIFEDLEDVLRAFHAQPKEETP
jgi:SulP family sulfate permease